jgi:hypothetical protein
VRKSIARVHTVYRANIRAALRSKISNDGANKKGRVSHAVPGWGVMSAAVIPAEIGVQYVFMG